MDKREDELTPKDKRLIRIKAISTLIFGLGIGGVTMYMVFFSDPDRSFDLPVYIFGFFFFGVLAFILFIRIRGAFQRVKNVYTGIVTDKREHTRKTRKDIGQTTYTIQLDDQTFTIDQALYNQVHRGDLVELHCLKGNLAFKVTVLQPATAIPSAHSDRQTVLGPTTNSEAEPVISHRNVLIRLLLHAFLFRIVIGGIGAYFVIFALNLTVLITMKDVDELLFYIDLIFYGTIILFTLFNLRTARLVLDLFSQKTRLRTETIIDMQSSNLPKPSRNAVRTYQGYYYRNDQFYYVQTQKHWLEISGSFYRSLETGNSLLITCGYFSGAVLQVEKATMPYL